MNPERSEAPMANNSGLAAVARRPRRAASSLSRQQRLAITVVAATLGLCTAYVMSRTSPQAAATEASGGGGGVAAADQDHPLSKQQQLPHSAQPKQVAGAAAAAAASDHSDKSRGAGGGGATSTAEGKRQERHGKAGAQQQQKQEREHVVHPGMEDERAWYSALSAEACRHVHDMRVCSHRGRLGAVEGVVPGSLPAYATLVKAGVSCFDIDFVATSDGQLLATHPEDLLAAIKSSGSDGSSNAGTTDLAGRVQQSSLEQLRTAGADEERFPTAETLIKMLASSLEDAGLLWRPAGGDDTPNYEELPVLLMDLKGGAYTPQIIDVVAAAAKAAEVTAHVALFVTTDEQLQLVQQQTKWAGPLVKAYMDRQDPNPPVTEEGLAPFTLLGPSIKMSDAFFAAVAKAGKPALAWTADSPPDLHRAAEARLNAVVSNRPIALRAVLMDWRDRCSERLRRQRQQRRRQLTGARHRHRQQAGEGKARDG